MALCNKHFYGFIPNQSSFQSHLLVTEFKEFWTWFWCWCDSENEVRVGVCVSGAGGCWSLDSVAMSATTLTQPNNTEHICFTIAQTFFSLYFPCLIVKVPDGAESHLRWKKRKEKCQTWKVRRTLPPHLQDNKPLTPVASGVMFQGISVAVWKCGRGNLLQSGWFDLCDWDLALNGDD